MLKYSILGVLLSILSCAVPCPRDSKIGSVHFSAETLNFIPSDINFKSLTFVNEKGETLTFNTTNSSVVTNQQIPVSTLCERGDFLDKTVQIEYLEAPAVNLFYQSNPEKFTLAIDVVFAGHMPNTGIQDTALIEKVTVWSQKIGVDAKSGALSVITSTRGNEKHKDLQNTLNQPLQYAIIKDTTIFQRKIKNAYYNPSKSEGMTIYYTQENNIEAFVTDDNEVWVRK
jgi:hypothetical protein